MTTHAISPRFYLLAMLLSVMACGSSGAAGGAGLATHCKDFEQGWAGAYVVENNTWGKGSIANFKQCVAIGNAANGGVDVAWEWLWPARGDTVRGYPEVIFGQKPWSDSTTTALPRIVDDVKAARVGFGHSSTHNGAGNLAFDVWLTSSNVRPAGADHLPIKHELMIWLDSWGGMLPAGPLVEIVAIGGINWGLHITSATWGPEPWQYIAYRPVSPVPRPIAIDVRLFLDHLKKRGSISGREWLSSIELGNELISGEGSTQLSNFKITIE